MDKARSYLIWLIIGILAVIPAAYFFTHLNDRAFVDSTLGNWFATMLGALVGVGIALELDHWQRRQNEAREQDEAAARKRQVLKLIKVELSHNQQLLSDRQPAPPAHPLRAISGARLKDEVWNAFSASGELARLEDAALLTVLANAYYQVRIVMFLEELLLQETRFKHDIRSSPGIANQLEKADLDTTAALNQAIDEIDRQFTL